MFSFGAISRLIPMFEFGVQQVLMASLLYGQCLLNSIVILLSIGYQKLHQSKGGDLSF